MRWRSTVPAGIWGQWKLSTPASRLPRLCKHNKVSLWHTGDLSQLLGWQHLLITWMSEWTWSLLNFFQAATFAFLHDEKTVGLPAGLGLHGEALHHVPRHAEVLHLDTGKLARLLCSAVMALTHRYTVCSASNEGYPNVTEDFTITEKAPTRAFSWLNAPTNAFTFKTLLRHYAERALAPR